MQQIEVHILEQSYTLTCPDGAQQRLLDAARRVDAAMTGIRDAGRPLMRDQVAVLAAVTIAFEAQDNTAAQEPPPEQQAVLHNLLQRLDAALHEDEEEKDGDEDKDGIAPAPDLPLPGSAAT